MTDRPVAGKHKGMNGTRVPLTLVIASLLTVLSIGVAVRANDLRIVEMRNAEQVKRVYEGELAKLTAAVRENTDAIRTLTIQAERNQTTINSHQQLEGHPGMQARVRELEMGRR